MSAAGIPASEVRDCLLCGAEGRPLYRDLQDRFFGVAGVWGHRICLRCGLIWLDPQPRPEEVGRLYRTYYTHAVPDYPARLVRLWQFVRDGVLAVRLGYRRLPLRPWQRALGRVLSWIGPIRELVVQSVKTLPWTAGGRILDVGCGNGKFLSNMRALGWDVTGVEPDPDAVRVGREQFGLCVHQGTVREAALPPAAFEAITMHHVIEHVADPVGLLGDCRRLLTPGGRLVVVTPNIRSLGHRVFAEAWRELDMPRHFVLFSPQTLRRCAERAGLRVLGVATTESKAREIWAASRLIRRDGALPDCSLARQGLRLALEGLTVQVAEHYGRWFADIGEELVLTATVDRTL